MNASSGSCCLRPVLGCDARAILMRPLKSILEIRIWRQECGFIALRRVLKVWDDVCCVGTLGMGANSQDVNKRLFWDFPVSIVKMVAIGRQHNLTELSIATNCRKFASNICSKQENMMSFFTIRTKQSMVAVD
jgi:hypothetical protein